MTNNKPNKKRSRRGFTLVESVVCIVIIIIVSIAAISASMATSDVVRRGDDRSKAIDQVEMIMSCYRTENFKGALELCGIRGYDKGNFTVYYNEDFEILGVTPPANDGYYCRIEVTVGDHSVGLKAFLQETDELLYKTEEWLG